MTTVSVNPEELLKRLNTAAATYNKGWKYVSSAVFADNSKKIGSRYGFLNLRIRKTDETVAEFKKRKGFREVDNFFAPMYILIWNWQEKCKVAIRANSNLAIDTDSFEQLNRLLEYDIDKFQNEFSNFLAL